jgi:hypothetical protein
MKNNHYILAIKFIDDRTINKTLFNIDGFIINNVTDYLLDNNIIKRVKHNIICTIENNVVVHVDKKLSIVPLRVNKPKKKDFVVDYTIGAIDTETFLDFDGIQKVYALGYRTNLEDYPITFYIYIDTMDSYKLIIDFIESLLRSKYDDYTFYCHNLGGYDVVFIIKALIKYNETNNCYNIKSIFRDFIILEYLKNMINLKIE